MAPSALDLLIISTLATRGVLMSLLPIAVVATTLAATAVFGLILDLIKVPVVRRMQINQSRIRPSYCALLQLKPPRR